MRVAAAAVLAPAIQARGLLYVRGDEDAGSTLKEWSSLIGIITAIAGNILISFALNIQRYAHIRLERDRRNRSKSWNSVGSQKSTGNKYGTQQEYIAEERAHLNLDASAYEAQDSSHYDSYHSEDQDDEATQVEKEDPAMRNTNYLRSPYWWAGLLLMTTGEAGNFLAYAFAPASIVSPLGVVALVSNCIIAPCLLKERFRQRDFWGVVIAIGGAVTVVLSAKNSETRMGPNDVWVAITRWEFELYLAITATMMITLVWLSGRYGEKTILVDLGLVGLFGGYTALSTKGVASLLSVTLWRALTFPITYLLVSILVATALLQIRYLNRALQRFDSTQVIPTQFVLFTLSVIIGSAVLYRDFESATLERVGKFVGGCVLTFLGVYLITSGRSHDDDPKDVSEMDDEQDGMIGLVDEESYDNEVEEVRGERNGAERKSLSCTTLEAKNGYDGLQYTPRERSDSYQSSPQTPKRYKSRSSSTASAPLVTLNERPDSPLLENPWLSSQHTSSQPSLGHHLQSTISSPVLPFETQDSRPGTERAKSQQPLSPSRMERPGSVSRNSIASLMPGPLMSPLSPSFAAVVADSQRRGFNSPVGQRRRLSGVRPSRSQRLDSEPSEIDPILAPSPLKSVQAPGDQESQPASDKGRSRSMGNALGEFFTFQRRNSNGQDEEQSDNNVLKRMRHSSGQ